MAQGPGTRFRELLAAEEVLLIPGGFSPLMARMCESLGFEAFFMAGSQTNAYVYGLPDVGLIGMREMVDAARRITAVSDLCVFMDGDTGWGNVLNVYRTVREASQAGVACVSIEDQEAPKKSGTSTGRRCIPQDEAVGKIKAAVEARDEIGSDLVICARCDLIGAEGSDFEEAVERCVAYVEDGGADVIWINTVDTKGHMAEACARIPGPTIPHYGGDAPFPSIEEMQGYGAAAMLFPALTTSIGLQAQWEFLNDFKRRGVDAQRDWGVRARESEYGAFSYQPLLTPSPSRVQDLESRLLPQEQQRDYEGTWGHGTVQ